MNIKITERDHERLCCVDYREYLFGSRLFGTATNESDWDYIRVYRYNDVFTESQTGLPNIHSFQVDLEGVQYIWMTEEQFWGGLLTGDGTIQSDIIMFSGKFEDPLELCRTYNTMKAYCGVAKRDLKLHSNLKKRFHAQRSLYIAEELINNRLPTKEEIQKIPCNLKDKVYLCDWERNLRTCLNHMLNDRVISKYYIMHTEDSLLKKMLDANNITEFKY